MGPTRIPSSKPARESHLGNRQPALSASGGGSCSTRHGDPCTGPLPPGPGRRLTVSVGHLAWVQVKSLPVSATESTRAGETARLPAHCRAGARYFPSHVTVQCLPPPWHRRDHRDGHSHVTRRDPASRRDSDGRCTRGPPRRPSGSGAAAAPSLPQGLGQVRHRGRRIGSPARPGPVTESESDSVGASRVRLGDRLGAPGPPR